MLRRRYWLSAQVGWQATSSLPTNPFSLVVVGREKNLPTLRLNQGKGQLTDGLPTKARAKADGQVGVGRRIAKIGGDLDVVHDISLAAERYSALVAVIAIAEA